MKTRILCIIVLIVLCLLRCSKSLLAQSKVQHANAELKDSQVVLTRDNFLPKATIKFNLPALLIDPKQALCFATDVKINKSLSVDGGIGAYFKSWAYSQYQGESFTGVRARLGFKYYYAFKKNVAPYVGLEALYNHSFAKQNYDVTKLATLTNSNGDSYNGPYTEKKLLTTETTSTGVSLRTGVQIYVGPKKQFLFDFYGGLGIKFTNRDRQSPADAYQIYRDKRFWLLDYFNFNYDRGPGHYIDPCVTLGVNIGYCFR